MRWWILNDFDKSSDSWDVTQGKFAWHVNQWQGLYLVYQYPCLGDIPCLLLEGSPVILFDRQDSTPIGIPINSSNQWEYNRIVALKLQTSTVSWVVVHQQHWTLQKKHWVIDPNASDGRTDFHGKISRASPTEASMNIHGQSSTCFFPWHSFFKGFSQM